MRVRWLGWAGAEIEAQGQWVVVDPLENPTAVFAPLGDRAAGLVPPDVVSPQAGAVAGMVTHLHLDHADAGALKAGLAPGAPVFEPEDHGGTPIEQAAIAQADQELSAADLSRRQSAPWASAEIGPFTLTALPAVDGIGDPQVSWLIEADGKRVLHLGDTIWHGWWWRVVERYGPPDVVLAPINGARLNFPHRQPPSPLAGALEPEQAALAAELLKAERLVPMHYGAYELPGIYEPVPEPAGRLRAASSRVAMLGVGEALEI